LGSAAIIVTAVVVAAAVILFIFARTKRANLAGIVQLSHLKCEKCGTEFDYAWIPGVSFTSVRLLRWRFFRCPVCGAFSVFDIWDTRVDPKTHHCPIQIGPS
jgi:hypothetical protein